MLKSPLTVEVPSLTSPALVIETCLQLPGLTCVNDTALPKKLLGLLRLAIWSGVSWASKVLKPKTFKDEFCVKLPRGSADLVMSLKLPNGVSGFSGVVVEAVKSMRPSAIGLTVEMVRFVVTLVDLMAPKLNSNAVRVVVV